MLVFVLRFLLETHLALHQHIMRFIIFQLLALLLAAPSAAMAQDLGEVEARGFTLLSKHCARCHAVTRSDISQHPKAPPFRILGRIYPIDALQEALAEGIIVGHPDMPEFKFEPNDVGALIAYLKYVQKPGRDKTQ
jgi:cytochrome c